MVLALNGQNSIQYEPMGRKDLHRKT